MSQNQQVNPFAQDKAKEEEKQKQNFLTVEQTESVLRKSIIERISLFKESNFSNSLTEKDLQFADQIFKSNTPYIQQLISQCYGDLYNPQNDLITKLGFDMLAYYNKDLHKEVVDLISQHYNQINLIGTSLQQAVFMLNQQNCNIVKNIKQLKRQFIYYTSGIRLPENQEQLQKIISTMRSEDVNHPALTDYIFADDVSVRCQTCTKWYESNEKANQCCKVKEDDKTLDKTKIKSSHQDFLRLLNVHYVIAQFMVKQTLSSSFKGYLKKEQELLTFKYAYEFLYCFVLNNKKNQTQLSDIKYMQLFWSHLEIPELAEDAIRLLTELLRDNDLANQMIQNNQIKIISKLLNPQQKQFKRRISIIIQESLNYQFRFSTVTDQNNSEEEQEDYEQDEENVLEQGKKKEKLNPFAEISSPISSKLKFEQQFYPVEVLELLKVLVVSDQGIKTDKVSVISEIVHDFLKFNQNYSHLLFLHESSELFKKKRKYNIDYLLEQSQKQIKTVKGSNLDFHLSFMDLLGILTLGQGVAVESFVKENLFRHEDMIDLMTSSLPLRLKKPFIRFCHGIYFSEIGEEEEVVEGVIGQQQYVVYLSRDDGKHIQQMLRNFISDIQELTKLYNSNDITKKQEYSYYVFQVLLPFITQLHNENHLSVVKDTEYEISPESKDQVANLFDELIASVILLCGQRQSLTFDNQKTVLISFLNSFIKNKTVLERKLKKNDSNKLLSLRQQIQDSLCANTEDIKTLNQLKLTRFILKVCLPDVLQLFYGIVQEILLEKNTSKEKIKQEVQQLRHEQELKNVDFSYYILVQQLKKLIFDVKTKQKRILEKIEQEEDEDSLKHLDYQNLIKQAFQQKLTKVGQKIEHKEYQNHIKGGELILKHLLTQCQAGYESYTSTSIYLIQAFQSVFILCGGIVRSINETQIEVSEYETPKDLLLTQHVLTEDGVQFVVNFVGQIQFPLSQASKIILKEVMKFAVLLTSYGNSSVQKELIDYYSMSCNKHQEGANFLKNIKNLFSQQANDLTSLIPDDQLQEVTVFILRFLKNWCEGHNLEAQNFIREQQTLRINVRIVLQISNLAKALATRFKKYYLYLSEKNSDHKVLLKYLKKYLPTSDRKRRYIDWLTLQQKPTDLEIALYIQIFSTLTEIQQGPCMENQNTLIQNRIFIHLSELFEFLGACNYNTSVNVNQEHKQLPLIGVSSHSLQEFQNAVFQEQKSKTLLSGYLKRVRQKRQDISESQQAQENEKELAMVEANEKDKEELEKYNDLEGILLEFLNALIEARIGDSMYQVLNDNLDIEILIANLHQHFLQGEEKQEIIYKYYAFLTAISENLPLGNDLQIKLNK